MSRPLAFSDAELDVLLNLARVVPPEHRDAFLRDVANALAAYREIGVGLIHREAAKLQARYVGTAVGAAGKYR